MSLTSLVCEFCSGFVKIGVSRGDEEFKFEESEDEEFEESEEEEEFEFEESGEGFVELGLDEELSEGGFVVELSVEFPEV